MNGKQGYNLIEMIFKKKHQKFNVNYIYLKNNKIVHIYI